MGPNADPPRATDAGSGPRPRPEPSDPTGAESGSGGAGESRAHLSFVQRLQRRLGRRVDPEINLQVDAASEAGLADEAHTKEAGSGSSASHDLLKRLGAGQTPLGTRYLLRNEIARGGMGVVMRVWDEDLRRNLAMKVMIGRSRGTTESGTPDVDEEKLNRFLEEAQITGQLDHPGVVPVHDLGLDPKGRCYFTMRLVRGRELKEVLDLAREKKEGWTTTRVLGLILKVCEAMAFAHSKGVVHRDLKPSNVMVGRFGETYVMDWGLARVLGRADTHDIRIKPVEDPSAVSLVRTIRKDESMNNPDSPLVTMDGDVVGTPSFMAPEQAQGKLEEVGPRSDVYSLGAILYYMLTGRAPYVKPGERVSAHTVLTRVLEGPPAPVGKLARDVPGELVAICEKAMAREAGRRYASMLEVADDILAFQENRVVRAYEGGSVAEFRKWVVRNRGMAAALAGMILVAFGSVVAFGVQQRRQVEAISEQQEQTQLAKAEAEANLRKAEDNEKRAQENLTLAIERQKEADENAAAALESEQLAKRSSYMANVLAADFSLRLDSAAAARTRLAATDPALRGWEWDHLSLVADSSLRTFDLDHFELDDLRLDPEGKRLYTFTRAGFRVTDLATGEPLEPANVVNLSWAAFLEARSMDVNRAGTRAAVTATSGSSVVIRIVDLPSGERLRQLPPEGSPGHERGIGAMRFSPDGKTLATGGADGLLILWDPEADTPGRRIEAHARPIEDLSWSPDGRLIATGSDDRSVRVFEVASGAELHRLEGHQAGVTCIAWHPSGASVVSGSADRTIRLWNLAAEDERTFVGHTGAVRACDVDSTGTRIASTGDDGTVRIWPVYGGDPEILLGHDGEVGHLTFSDDDRLLVTAGRDFTVRVWDGRGRVSESRPAFPDGVIAPAAFRLDGERFCTATTRDSVVLWDSTSLEPLAVLSGHDGYIGAVEFSPDGRWLVSGSGDKTARVWDARTGELVRVLPEHDKRIAALCISPDSRWVATGSGGGWLRAFDLETGAELAAFEAQDGWISSIAVSPDGRYLATGGTQREILLWSPWEPEPAKVLEGHERRGVRALVFTSDGSRLISGGSSDDTARVWNVETGECELVLSGHEATITCIARTSDDSRIATGSIDRTVRIWDAVSGGTLVVLPFGEEVASLQFSADDRRLLVGGQGGFGMSTGSHVAVYETDDVHERSEAWYAYRERRDRAKALVDDLFDRHFFVTDVLLHLRTDAEVDDELRSTCERLARFRGDDPQLLRAANRRLLSSADLSTDEYEHGLRRALAALSLDREDPVLQVAVGAAQYRAGRYGEAVETLRAAAGELLAPGRRGDPRVGATGDSELLLQTFLAMALERTGDAVRAREHLDGARQVLRDRTELESDGTCMAVLREAEGLIGGSPGSAVPGRASAPVTPAPPGGQRGEAGEGGGGEGPGG